MLFTVWVSLAALVRFAAVAVLQSLRLCPCCCCCCCGGGATAVGVYRCLRRVGARERRAAVMREEGAGGREESPPGLEMDSWKLRFLHWIHHFKALRASLCVPPPTRPLRTCLLVVLDNIHGGAGDKPVRAHEPLLDINQTLSGKPRNMLFMVHY